MMLCFHVRIKYYNNVSPKRSIKGGKGKRENLVMSGIIDLFH